MYICRYIYTYMYKYMYIDTCSTVPVYHFLVVDKVESFNDLSNPLLEHL